jgi:HAD superfamily hydrolase (TIGR01509 family)
LSVTAVIFDCDGVLVDSEPVSNALLAEILTEIGLPTTLERSVRDFMGRSWAHAETVIAERLGAPPPPELELRYRERLFAAYAAGVPAIVGIADALDAITLPRCIASSGDHERIRMGLRAAGLLDRFSEHEIFSAYDVDHGKPAPDLFLHAAAQMGFEPAATAVVEDSVAGVQAGVGAGMVVLGYAATTPAEELRDAGATTFADMAELPRLLGSAAVTQKA